MTAASRRLAAIEVKTERDVNVLTNEPVLRIIARKRGDRRWQRFLVLATKTEPLDYLERHAEMIAEKWLSMSGADRG